MASGVDYIEELNIFYWVVSALLALLALFGNLLTIVAVIKFENLQTIAKLLFLCLAVFDAASGFVVFSLDAWISSPIKFQENCLIIALHCIHYWSS